jgi:elongation factor Ts
LDWTRVKNNFMEKIKMGREKTGAGMVDCKKALDESGGDIEKAVEILRKKGIAKAAKRGEREASEGIILVEVNEDKNTGYLLQLNAETDFVAKNEKFQTYAADLMKIIVEKKPASLEELMSNPMEAGTAQETLDNLSGTIGEKMTVKNFEIMESLGGTVSGYTHSNGRIGVLVSFDKKVEEELARDIAMHIAAANPKYLSPEEVPAVEIEKEKEIYVEQLKKEGKPEAIMNKIIEGKVAKYFEEVCLLKQEYIKDDKKKIENILQGAKIQKFSRYFL